MPPIYKDNASVHKVSVDIQVARADGKQMTLSMFRQLPETLVLNAYDTLETDGSDEFRIVGNPWGRVLYNFGNNTDWVDYWVLLEMGGLLYRAPSISRVRRCNIITRLGKKQVVDNLSVFIWELLEEKYTRCSVSLAHGHMVSDKYIKKFMRSPLVSAISNYDWDNQDNEYVKLNFIRIMSILEKLEKSTPQLFIAL